MLTERERFMVYATAKATLHSVVAELQTQTLSYPTGVAGDAPSLRHAQELCGALRRVFEALPTSEALQAYHTLLLEALAADEAFIVAAFRCDGLDAAGQAMTEARDRLNAEQAQLAHRLWPQQEPPIVAAA